jgi:hypothetical protein
MEESKEQKLFLPQNHFGSSSNFSASKQQNSEVEILLRTKNLLLLKMQKVVDDERIGGFDKE